MKKTRVGFGTFSRDAQRSAAASNALRCASRLNHPCAPCRSGFTLVELLVVIALLAVLVGLAIMIIPGITEGQTNIRAATQLQQWIEIAKQRAAGDRAPRGIRFIFNPASPTQVTQMMYVMQPDPYTLGMVPDPNVPPSMTTTLNIFKPSVATVSGTNVTFSYNIKTLWGGFGQGQAGLWPVQPNDFIELSGVLYRIAGVPTTTSVTLNSAVSAPLATSNYRFIRQPRPMDVDDPLNMAQDIVVDLKPRNIVVGGVAGKYDLPVPTTTAPLDIIFSPDGRVMPTVVNNLTAYDKIILWVRDATVPDGQGDPTLVVVYPRTGMIAAQPVDVTYLTTNPYTFVTSGQRSD